MIRGYGKCGKYINISYNEVIEYDYCAFIYTTFRTIDWNVNWR